MDFDHCYEEAVLKVKELIANQRNILGKRIPSGRKSRSSFLMGLCPKPRDFIRHKQCSIVMEGLVKRKGLQRFPSGALRAVYRRTAPKLSRTGLHRCRASLSFTKAWEL